MPDPRIVVVEVDPQGQDALVLLREAALEARGLYPELHRPEDPWPTNGPTPPRGIYLVAYREGLAVGMGAHRPLDASTSEVRRMYVLREARTTGIAQAILQAIEAHARAQGFACLRLETGMRQGPAIRLYERAGFVRIPAFGLYVDDPTSVCFEKVLHRDATRQTTPPAMGLPDTTATRLRCIELRAEDAPALQTFFEANPLYFEAVGGQAPQPGEALAEITDRPPASMSWRRVWPLAFTDRRGQIVAMAGVVTDLMAEGVWHIGLFIVATARHGSGEAHALYRAIEDWAHANGAQWMRLGVVVGHARAERFWQRCGFVELRQREGLTMGRLTQTVRVMLKPLTGLPIESYLAQVERDRPASTSP